MGFRAVSRRIGKGKRGKVGAKGRQRLAQVGAIGMCSTCGDVSYHGFKCSCKVVECTGCWFKRTGGFQNAKSPEWHCHSCGKVSIYDQDMNFIKRWEHDQWKKWNGLGNDFEKEADKVWLR